MHGRRYVCNFLLVLISIVDQTVKFVREVKMLWSEGARLICISVLIVVLCFETDYILSVGSQ